MNWLQKVTLLLGGVLMLANFVYPPWHSLISGFSTYKPTAFAFLTELSRASILNPPPSYIDWGLLGVTAGAILAGTAVAFGAATFFKKCRRS